MTPNDWIFVGAPVICNHHRGNISEILHGAVIVRLDRGQVWIDLDDVGLYPDFVLPRRRGCKICGKDEFFQEISQVTNAS